MLVIKGRVRQWGSSLGVVLPKQRMKAEGIRKDDVVKIVIQKDNRTLQSAFGSLHFKETTEKILRVSDEEAWDE